MAKMDETPANVELMRLAVDQNLKITFEVAIWVWALLALFVIALFAIRRLMHGSVLGKKYEVDSAELGVGDSKLTFKPNINDKSVAYKIWVELSTRKIGLPIDLDDDVIVEIYDSWYSFFSVTRELIKDIPVTKVRNPSTRKIISLSIDVLNLGLRPHLTKWQARFRRWYDRKLSQDPNAELHPQDIQQEFPQYSDLVSDMIAVNKRLMLYRERMNSLVHY